MKKPMELVNNVRNFGRTNKAELLSVAAVITLWGSIIAAYKAGPKAEKILAEKKQDLKDTDENDKKAKATVVLETVKEIVPVVAPTVALGTAATGCIIKSNSVSNKKIAELSAAYTIVSTAYHEHKDKVREVLGEAKAQQVREAISKEHLDNSLTPNNDTGIIPTGLGSNLCYDEYTDRFFYCSAEAIGQAILRLSYRLPSEMWISLNEFYQEINLRPCKMGDDLGWSVDDTDNGRIPIYYTAILNDANQPCLCVQFDVSLRESFKSY